MVTFEFKRSKAGIMDDGFGLGGGDDLTVSYPLGWYLRGERLLIGLLASTLAEVVYTE